MSLFFVGLPNDVNFCERVKCCLPVENEGQTLRLHPTFCISPMDIKTYQKLPNDVFSGKLVCIVILDLISGIE